MKTVSELVNGFLGWAQRALSVNSVYAYRFHLTRFCDVHGTMPIRKLRPAHLSAWAKTWHQVQAVQRLFNWAVHEAGLLSKNPVARVRKPRRPGRRRVMSAAELARLIRHARPAARRFLLALRETMARPQEVRAIRWEDIVSEDLRTPLDKALYDGKAIVVLYEWKDCDRRQDSSRPRVLLITRRLGRMLCRMRSKLGTPTGEIFLGHHGQKLTKNAVRIMFRRLRKRAGFVPDVRGEQICAYTVRHSMATEAAAAGVLDRALADLLGHTEVRTTGRYQHLATAHLRAAREKMNRRKRGDGEQPSSPT